MVEPQNGFSHGLVLNYLNSKVTQVYRNVHKSGKRTKLPVLNPQDFFIDLAKPFQFLDTGLCFQNLFNHSAIFLPNQEVFDNFGILPLLHNNVWEFPDFRWKIPIFFTSSVKAPERIPAGMLLGFFIFTSVD